ncbi:unnamed protein product [Sphagnum tenellum]
MPLYRWEGIDITGSVRTGILEAQSHANLEQLLLADGIALMHAAQSHSLLSYMPELPGRRIRNEHILLSLSKLQRCLIAA